MHHKLGHFNLAWWLIFKLGLIFVNKHNQLKTFAHFKMGHFSYFYQGRVLIPGALGKYKIFC